MKTDPVYRLGLLADLHVGSRYAIVPPAFRPTNAGASGAFMSWMWDAWSHFVKDCPPLDALIINGDALEGETPSMRAPLDAVDDNPHRQVDMALDALGPLRDKTRKIWLVRGTPFHDSKHHEPIEILGRELKCEPWADRRFSGYVLDGAWRGLRIDATHHQSIGAIYGGTLADRTTLMASAAESQGKAPHADLVVRSHTHRAYLGQSHGRWFLSTRCWKLANPYAIQKMERYRAALLCDIGAHVLILNERGEIAWKEYSYQPYKAEPRMLA